MDTHSEHKNMFTYVFEPRYIHGGYRIRVVDTDEKSAKRRAQAVILKDFYPDMTVPEAIEHLYDHLDFGPVAAGMQSACLVMYDDMNLTSTKPSKAKRKHVRWSRKN
jgi:hypothetical protein